MKSRKRLSTATKRLRATRRLDREPGADPASAPCLARDPVPPELAGNQLAIVGWRRLAPLIADCLEWSRYLDLPSRVAAPD